MTTNLSWRLVFVGEVVVAAGILLGVRYLADEVREGPQPEVDWVGSALSASGLGLIVFGVLRSSSWGFLRPGNSPVEPFGFSLTPFVIGACAVVLVLFVQWQHHREHIGREPLVKLEHLKIPSLRSRLSMFLAQDLILIATLAPRLASRVSPRLIVRVGLVVLLLACLVILSVIDPQIDTGPFLVAMAVLGVGMGLPASQLGNVVQSAVDESARSEAGGLQFTAQQPEAALGTALMGAIVIGGLATAVGNTIGSDPHIGDATQQQVSVQLEARVPFIPADDVRDAATGAGVSPEETDVIVAS